MAARGIAAGSQQALADAVHYAAAADPLHCGNGVFAHLSGVVIRQDVRILADGDIIALKLRVAEEHCRQLLAGHVCVRGKIAVIVTLDDAVRRAPDHGVIVPAADSDVAEDGISRRGGVLIACGELRRALETSSAVFPNTI